MAYSRRRIRGNRRRSKKAWYDKKYSTAQLARKAWRATKYIKGLVNSEMLQIINSSSTAIPNTGAVVSLSNIAQGDTVSGRTGNSVLARTFLLRAQVTKHASATETFVRIMLIWDTQQIGDTAPTIATVLDSVDTLSGLNVSTTGRYKILMNKHYTLDTTRTSSIYINKFFNIYKHIRYNGTGDSDIQKNGLYMVLLGNEATNTPLLSYMCKLGYHDN